jgi:hypothetical protein
MKEAGYGIREEGVSEERAKPQGHVSYILACYLCVVALLSAKEKGGVRSLARSLLREITMGFHHTTPL